jgi:hypothetical protein
MKQPLQAALVAAVVAALVSIAVLKLVPSAPPAAAEPPLDIDALAERLASRPALAGKLEPTVLSYTSEPAEDAWVDGARQPGADHRSLAPAANSICYLTKIEVKGMTSAADSSSCRISVDDFTGYWQLTGEVAEGAKSQVRCNARCLVWPVAQGVAQQ